MSHRLRCKAWFPALIMSGTMFFSVPNSLTSPASLSSGLSPAMATWKTWPRRRRAPHALAPMYRRAYVNCKPTLPNRTNRATSKKLLTDLHVSTLNRAKAENAVALDVLFRLAFLKFQRVELVNQYGLVLERCRGRMKMYEGPRQSGMNTNVELRERYSQFQINKKAVLRRAGQDLFTITRDAERETLGKTRRSLFGDGEAHIYDLLMNRLTFTEDGQDNVLNAEHYVMLGTYERDVDRFEIITRIAKRFLTELGVGGDGDAQAGLLNVPENAHEILAGGAPDDSPKGKAQKAMLGAWVDML